MRLIKQLLRLVEWWLGSVKSQIIGIFFMTLASTGIVYVCMRNSYIPIFTFPIELGAIGLFAIVGAIAILFRGADQIMKLKYFARMPWMNVLYAQIAVFFILSVSSYILTQSVPQDAPSRTIICAFSVSVGIIVLMVFCVESIALMRQLRVRGK